MNTLLVVGDSIRQDSSTNIFKSRIIQEIAKYGNVYVLMDDSNHSEGKYEQVVLENVTYYIFSRKLWFHYVTDYLRKSHGVSKRNHSQMANHKTKSGAFLRLYQTFNEKYVSIFLKKYRFNSSWLRNIKSFNSSVVFDYVISISHPPASHNAAVSLIAEGNIKSKRYIQVWFEPWFQVPFNKNKTELILQEEKSLISEADAIFYVSPIFCDNQKLLFQQYAKKMNYIDLPIVINKSAKNNIIRRSTKINVGYFGNYYSSIRNIIPLYKAIRLNPDVNGIIIGNSDIHLEGKNNLVCKSRVSYNAIKEYEFSSDILVVLSNFEYQIPGKVYDYSQTNKYVLFVLDGEKGLKRKLREYYSTFNRYVFCENSVEDISLKIEEISIGKYKSINNSPVSQFDVKNVVRKIIDV